MWPHLSEPEDVEWSLDNSLQMLGTDYVDAFLIHWPFAVERTEDRKVKLGSDGKVGSDPSLKLVKTNPSSQYTIKKSLTDDLSPTWRAMEKMYKAGKARSIGVSNWKISGLETMLKYAEIKPNSESGQNTLNRQLERWKNKGVIPEGAAVQPITYDANGNVYLGFKLNQVKK